MSIRAAYCVLTLALGLSFGAAGAADDAQPRIVSLSPHITELLFAAGAGDRIVGVDDLSDYPPAAAAIAHVGEVSALDIEALLKLKPTLVILWDSGTPQRRKAELERLNLRLYVTEQRHLDDIGTSLIEFGRLAGTAAVAEAAARKYRDDLQRLRMRYAQRPKLSVFYQVWDRPLYTLSGKQVLSEMLTLCGGENVFADLSALAPAVDREAVLARNPDVIIIGASGADGERQIRDWDRFPALKAVQAHRVFSVDPTLTSRMAPRTLEGVQAICSLLDQARTSRTGNSGP
jgi:iron complex transport system substrate-binding protein